MTIDKQMLNDNHQCAAHLLESILVNQGSMIIQQELRKDCIKGSNSNEAYVRHHQFPLTALRRLDLRQWEHYLRVREIS